MQLSDELRKYLIDELRVAAARMHESKGPVDKLYYYSAAFAAVQRVLNIDYSPAILLLQWVLLLSHQQVNARLLALREGREASIQLEEEMLDGLTTLTSMLADRIYA